MILVLRPWTFKEANRFVEQRPTEDLKFRKSIEGRSEQDRTRLWNDYTNEMDEYERHAMDVLHDPLPPPHGTEKRWGEPYNCRCDTCIQFHSDRERALELRKIANSTDRES
jgi:hypothetical protein